MKGTSLGEFEELVLLSIAILHGDAYGLSILHELDKRTGRKIMISSVHKVLVRLEKKGYLVSHLGGATEERGGRSKKLYELTMNGKGVLLKSRELRNDMWADISQLILLK
jgi:DNA-binding PadR family transcriptional regulator